MSATQHASAVRAFAAAQWLLRSLVSSALVVDAVVHLRLASDYQLAAPSGIGGGNMFRIEAVVAIVAAVYVLVRGSRTAYVVAFSVAFSALVAVILYRYVDVPQIGPVPAMYEPVWFFEKSLSAVAEGIGAIAAVAGVLSTSRRGRSEGNA